jgi:antirestriction protein
MAQDINISQASIYVGTYRKYNNGSIEGKWLNLSDYSDISEFFQACQKLHSDEADPEYMFQDYEHIPEAFISECSLSEKFFPYRDAIEQLANDQAEAFQVWCNNNHSELSSQDIDDLIASFEDQYIGQYKDEEDFAMEHVEMNYELPEFALRYFDYKAFANDLFCGAYWFDDGFVFRNQ